MIRGHPLHEIAILLATETGPRLVPAARHRYEVVLERRLAFQVDGQERAAVLAALAKAESRFDGSAADALVAKRLAAHAKTRFLGSAARVFVVQQLRRL